METIFTILGLIIASVGLCYAIKTYNAQFQSKPDEELQHLKAQFKANQTLSLRVQMDLEKFIQENNAWEEYMFPGVKYGTYLEEMKHSFKVNLSDDLFNELESLDLTKTNILSMTNSLDEQFKALSQIQTSLLLQQRQHNQ